MASSTTNLFCLSLLLMTLMAIAIESSPLESSDLSTLTSMGHDEELFEDNEMLFDSVAPHRQLADKKRYLSYAALRMNNVPCNRRGNSYYNCRNAKKANPYTRGCSAITNCKRYTDRY